MSQGNLFEVLGREVRQGSSGELLVESSPSHQRRSPSKTNKGMPDEAADTAALTYLLTQARPFLERSLIIPQRCEKCRLKQSPIGLDSRRW